MIIGKFKEFAPKLSPGVVVLDSAVITGDVEMGPQCSIWFHAVARADVNCIRIGRKTNIQDMAMLHVTYETHPLIIGSEVTIGHRVTLHGCTVEDLCLIGIGAIVLDGAKIGHHSIVAAGSLVTPGTVIPPNSMVMGAPAKVRRQLTEEEISHMPDIANRYLWVAEDYVKTGLGKRIE
ncbi:MAG: gamma carbonic anhydrase family protein [Deltaproteobacteria bacterium]|nr:gamma carbonic anhydrase family protein [Deltaproteobacteria bacterium]MBF0527305.1 gamma carbonic anhydrase family protein [Deltaproteobacteria bacterium]